MGVNFCPIKGLDLLFVCEEASPLPKVRRDKAPSKFFKLEIIIEEV